ncbi:MAG: hypothetical protein PVJ16_08620 [Nitrosopumilaceae archaeon]|jgi:hypothetical protein
MVMSSNLDTEIKEFDEVLKSTDMLVDESVQIYELENEKGNVVDELYNSLKIITEFLGFSIELPSKIFNEPESTKVTLNPSLDIIIKKENGKIEQKRLDEFSTKKIAEILKDSIMPIIELCKNEKIIQNKNITFLKAVTGKLEKIQKINSYNIKSESFTDSETRGAPNNLNQQNPIAEPQESTKTPEVS